MNEIHATNEIIIATRQSPLALWQADEVAKKLLKEGVKTKLLKLSTKGDQKLSVPIGELGGKGVFVKELQKALLDDTADIAVHSLKDMPVQSPNGINTLAVLKRDFEGDVLVFRKDNPLFHHLPSNCILSEKNFETLSAANIGTGSLRRKCLLLTSNKILKLHPLRGNIGTRMDHVIQGSLDAIVLSEASVKRMPVDSSLTFFLFDKMWFVPSAGQGVIAVEASANSVFKSQLSKINHPQTEKTIKLERSILEALGADCKMPVGIHAFEDKLLVCVLDHKQNCLRRMYVVPASYDLKSFISEIVCDLIAFGVNTILENLGIDLVGTNKTVG